MEYKKEYNEKNKEKSKEYYELNKEYLKEKSKEYRIQNKEIIHEKRFVQNSCICGGNYITKNISRHNKTKLHQNYINEKE